MHWRLFWQGCAWLGVALLVYLSLSANLPALPGPLVWDKMQHTLAYALLMIWFWQAFQPHWRWPLFLLMLGVLLELLQSQSSSRVAELSDILANALGISLGLYLAVATPIGRLLPWLEKTLRAVITTSD